VKCWSRKSCTAGRGTTEVCVDLSGLTLSALNPSVLTWVVSSPSTVRNSRLVENRKALNGSAYCLAKFGPCSGPNTSVNQCSGMAKARNRSINSCSFSFLYALKGLSAFSHALKSSLYCLSKPFGESGIGAGDFCRPTAIGGRSKTRSIPSRKHDRALMIVRRVGNRPGYQTPEKCWSDVAYNETKFDGTHDSQFVGQCPNKRGCRKLSYYRIFWNCGAGAHSKRERGGGALTVCWAFATLRSH